jgi:hypothetical protein
MNFRPTLILTFSLREKEPPLPLGEGWGEGNLVVTDFVLYS